MARVFVGLGSNLGDRAARIVGGLRGCVGHGLRLAALSPLYESAAVGGPSGQPNYLNAVAIVETGLDPMVVLRILQSVEEMEGRVRAERNAPRTLDLDLLLYGEEIRDLPGLAIPHPRLHERLFVLRPLVDVAPEAWIPTIGATAAELLARRAAALRDPNEDARLYISQP